MISRLFGLCLLGLSWAAPLWAATVEGLNGAIVPIADRSDAETARGLGEAFRQVLVKLTGSSATLSDPRVRRLLGRAKEFVTVMGQAEAAVPTEGPRLRAEFDAAALTRALREAGLPVWGRERPQLTAWLGVGGSEGVTYAPTEPSLPVFKAFDETVARRGLPLSRTTPANPPSAKSPLETLIPASTGAEAAEGSSPQLAGLLTPAPEGGWRATWRAKVKGEVTDWSDQGAEPSALAVAGVERAADLVGGHYTDSAAAAQEATSFEFTVAGIDSAAAWGRVMQYLRGVEIIERLTVVDAVDDRVRFRLAVRGGLPALREMLLVSAPLAPQTNSGAVWTLKP